MKQSLTRLLGALKTLTSLVLPLFQKAPRPGALGRTGRIALHIAAVLLVLLGLFSLNLYFRLPINIPGATWMGISWLPILFLLVYVECWLAYWLWLAWNAEDEGAHYPDIEEAWEQAKAALAEARLGLVDLPLFLVLGEPEDEEQALFQAAHLSLEVKQAPDRPDAPLHVYATREAIFLTCGGASVLGYYARVLAGKVSADPKRSVPQPDDELLNTIMPGGRSPLMPDKGPKAMADVMLQAERENRSLTKADKRHLRFLYRQDRQNRAADLSNEKILEQTARLEYLCRLVLRDRHPFCPINGVLLLIPFAGCDSDQEAALTADALHRDLAAAATLKVDCPHFAMVCDMETAHGFQDFAWRFTPQERGSRVGSSCPLFPDFRVGVDSSDRGHPQGPSTHKRALRMLESLAIWVCEGVVTSWLRHKFLLEKSTGDDVASLVRSNARVFLLADELKQRSARLASILTRGLNDRARSGNLLFGGCYLAGTGPDPKEQAFVRGVLKLLVDRQSCVYWNAQTVAREAAYARQLHVGWTILAVLAMGVLTAAGFFLVRSW